jgi:mono/diheme cytochrome c family protein
MVCGRSLFAAVLALSAAGCRQDMHDQPKYKPLRASDFFADKRASRPLVAGTVARGSLREDALFFRGKLESGALTDTLPMPLTAELLDRGRVQFQTFCAPCHGRTGSGDGMIVQRGFKRPSSYHVARLRMMPVGYFYDVITNGFGAMSDYAAQVTVKDRWAIAAYVRTLQLSQYAPVDAVPAAARAALESSSAGSPGAGGPAGAHEPTVHEPAAP